MINFSSLNNKYIAINATALFKRNKTGVEWYTVQLLKYLAKVWNPEDLPVVLLFPKRIFDEKSLTFSLPKNWHLCEIKGRYFWTQFHLLKFLQKNPPKLLFSPSYISPSFLKNNIQSINVVHGLEGEYFDQGNFLKFFLKPIYKRTLQKSSFIISVSKHTKEDLINIFRLDPSRIKTIKSGPGTLDDTEVSILVKNDFQKDRDKIRCIFFGGSARKNFKSALRIFYHLSRESQKKSVLYIVGQKNADLIEQKMIKKIGNRIVSLKYLPEAKKKKLLEKIHFFLYPSFYEGFGFPILESQALSTIPVTQSNNGCDEISGDCAIEFFAGKEKQAAIELNAIFSKPQQYNFWTDLGKNNVQKYKWEKCARKIKSILLKNN